MPIVHDSRGRRPPTTPPPGPPVVRWHEPAPLDAATAAALLRHLGSGVMRGEGRRHLLAAHAVLLAYQRIPPRERRRLLADLDRRRCSPPLGRRELEHWLGWILPDAERIDEYEVLP